MSWLVYPVFTLMFSWGVIIPFIYGGKQGPTLSLGLLTALVLSYLLFLELRIGT